jgi:hypothetical protein
MSILKVAKIKLNPAKRTSLMIDGRELRCEVHARRDEPEGDDILLISDSESEYFVHGAVFFKSLVGSSATFLSDLEPDQLKCIRKSKLVYCDTMDDSRSGLQFEISGVPVELMGHYLDARFYPLALDDSIMAIVTGLVDIEGAEVPCFIAPMRSDWLLFSSAKYDEDDDWWEYIDPDDPTGEKASLESERLLQEIIDLDRMKKAQQGEEGSLGGN